jgi:elongation factor Ts
MSQGNTLDKVKKLRELTGVGFKDCKIAIDENNGDIEKSIDFLRKKGIAKSNKKMERIAADGLVCICEKENKFSIIEVNSETDFVAKNDEFIKFVEEISNLTLLNSGKMEDILISKMKNKNNVKDNLVSLISKIGEKITLRRSDFVESGNFLNFSYTHAAIKKNLGKIGVLLSFETTKKKDQLLVFGKQLAMHIAASSPLSIDKGDLDQNILKKEMEIITEELKNSGKDTKIVDKIAAGKLNKFITDNTLVNQEWIMEPKKQVKDVLKEIAGKDKIEIKKFTRFKVGEGI